MEKKNEELIDLLFALIRFLSLSVSSSPSPVVLPCAIASTICINFCATHSVLTTHITFVLYGCVASTWWDRGACFEMAYLEKRSKTVGMDWLTKVMEWCSGPFQTPKSTLLRIPFEKAQYTLARSHRQRANIEHIVAYFQQGKLPCALHILTHTHTLRFDARNREQYRNSKFLIYFVRASQEPINIFLFFFLQRDEREGGERREGTGQQQNEIQADDDEQKCNFPNNTNSHIPKCHFAS